MKSHEQMLDEVEADLYLFTVDGKYYTAKSKTHAEAMLHHPNTYLFPNTPADFPLTKLLSTDKVLALMAEAAKVPDGMRFTMQEIYHRTKYDGLPAHPKYEGTLAKVFCLAREALAAAPQPTDTDPGRPVKPHRSGGGHWVGDTERKLT